MTALDWIVAGFTLSFALFGFGHGFIVAGISLSGFAAGAFVGTRVAPLLLADGSRSPYAAFAGLLCALGIGLAATVLLEGFAVELRRHVRWGPAVALDGLLGAALMAALALALFWIAGAAALQNPRTPDLRRAVQRSAVLRALNDALPPTGPVLNALARVDPFPRVEGTAAGVSPPDEAVLRDPEIRAASRAVVRILGSACGLGLEGSGWVAGSELVVTNAHVVAGESDTVVQRGGTGARLRAVAVWFDPQNDIALLRVPGLGINPLALDPSPPRGTAGAILGYPLDGPFDARPARLGSRRIVLAEDAYGEGPRSRPITSLRGLVRSGNSGGPVVDGDGKVLTTVFAATLTGTQGGYGVPNDVVRSALDQVNPNQPTGTGPCTR